MKQDVITFSIRPALSRDVSLLAALEKEVFSGDRISARSFRDLINSRSAIVFAADDRRDEIIGSCVVLFRKTTSVARLYSVAVSAKARGLGVAQALVAQAEEAARNRGKLFMRLEVRGDNIAATKLYKKLGYDVFGRYLDYYEDHAGALRFDKSLVPLDRGL